MVDVTRMAWGGVLLWLFVVVAGSAVAWVAIDEAGRGIGSSEPSFTASAGPTGSATTPPRSTPTHRPSPTSRPSSTRPTSGPTTGATPTTSGPTAVERVRTWSGTAGTVTVACRGAAASLRAATPADGWRAEREDSGPGVRVKFERGETTTVVTATCAGGVPRFRVGADD
jgi:hypothetical protein